ncbi:hypothetical protein ACJJTC_016565 [Scirpophaga incertulas]
MTKKGLKIIYQNVRGLRTKTNTFYNNTLISNCDIALITETWLCDGILNSELCSNNAYDVFRRDRGSLGGGVMALCARHLQARERPEWGHTELECLWLTLKLTYENYISLLKKYFTKLNAIHRCAKKTVRPRPPLPEDAPPPTNFLHGRRRKPEVVSIRKNSAKSLPAHGASPLSGVRYVLPSFMRLTFCADILIKRRTVGFVVYYLRVLFASEPALTSHRREKYIFPEYKLYYCVSSGIMKRGGNEAG